MGVTLPSPHHLKNKCQCDLSPPRPYALITKLFLQLTIHGFGPERINYCLPIHGTKHRTLNLVSFRSIKASKPWNSSRTTL